MRTRDGILTVWSVAYALRPRLRIASPWVEYRCPGTLEFSADRVFTCLVVTCANILSSKRSSRPRGSTFTAFEMLSYRYVPEFWS